MRELSAAANGTMAINAQKNNANRFISLLLVENFVSIRNKAPHNCRQPIIR